MLALNKDFLIDIDPNLDKRKRKVYIKYGVPAVSAKKNPGST